MNPLHQDFLLGLGDPSHLGRVAFRLVMAIVLGGVLGFEREEEGKSAGLKTHMLVSLGAALFMLVCIEYGADVAGVTRVAQGLTTAIGFLGGGAILKLTDQNKIKGLTTAANLWVAAAIGMAAGMGFVWPAVITVILAWFILVVVHRIEPWLRSIGKKAGLISPEKPPAE